MSNSIHYMGTTEGVIFSFKFRWKYGVPVVYKYLYKSFNNK